MANGTGSVPFEHGDLVRIGTRGSPLALAQANMVRDQLLAAHDTLSAEQVEIVAITTKGDRILDTTLALAGGKGLFTEEIEQGLVDGMLDLPVDSMKDMPTQLPPGLDIPCMLQREDVRDAFISKVADSYTALAPGSIVGTASLRRQAQILRLRPDLVVEPLRGNVQTRLRKVTDGVVDATFLALAGLSRLDLQGEATAIMSIDDMLPAVAQGAIGIEARKGDDRISTLLAPLSHRPTEDCVAAERSFLAVLDGSCRTPIAGLAMIDADQIVFRGEILSPDGSVSYEATRTGPVADGVRLGADAGTELRAIAGPGFFDDH